MSTRVQALLDSGTVSVVAVAHPELLGLKALAHVSIAVSGPMTPVLDALIASEAAVYISAVSGQYNVIAELRVPSHDDLYRAIAELRSQRGVRSVSTLVYVDVIKGIMPETALQADIRLDSTDVALIELLERNGQMPFPRAGRTHRTVAERRAQPGQSSDREHGTARRRCRQAARWWPNAGNGHRRQSGLTGRQRGIGD